MAEIDPNSRSPRMSNAGCPYPFHYRAETRDIVELQVDAFATICEAFVVDLSSEDLIDWLMNTVDAFRGIHRGKMI